MKQRSFWGWGYDEDALGDDERAGLRAMLGARLGVADLEELPAPRVEDVRLAEPRFHVPDELASIVTTAPRERAAHAYGKAFRDVVRGLERDFRSAPDAVALPRSEEDVERLLAFCERERIAAIPYGGGSSVVGGVEARSLGALRGAITIDLAGLDRVLELDVIGRAARIQAGIYGPALEEALRPHGLTLRHFPQSFEFSTLGGWIATRAGGHFATLHTHIDDFVEGLHVVTPGGRVATRRLPASGAGPQPERVFLGSEGALGIITEAWMRLSSRPTFRASVTVRFADFYEAANAARLLAQSGLHPSNCRVLDADEALNNGAGDGTEHLLLVAFESSDHALEPWLARAVELCRDGGGNVDLASQKIRSEGAGAREGAAGTWRSQFIRGPYLRDALVRLGLVVETFETAVTWDRFQVFCEAVKTAVRKGLQEVAGTGLVTCRLTHVYPDGVAPYFTVIAPAKKGSAVAQWDVIKAAASEAILEGGGTITHHHAVGRDHMPFYERERPELFGRALQAVKGTLDPRGIMNPGVLVRHP